MNNHNVAQVQKPINYKVSRGVVHKTSDQEIGEINIMVQNYDERILQDRVARESRSWMDDYASKSIAESLETLQPARRSLPAPNYAVEDLPGRSSPQF